MSSASQEDECSMLFYHYKGKEGTIQLMSLSVKLKGV